MRVTPRAKCVPACLLSLAMLVTPGCATHPDYATQFRFPIEWGSIAEGQAAFEALGCNQCHTVSGVDIAPYDGDSPVSLELGGTITYAKTYADLVTSIINPDHALADDYLDTLPPEARRSAHTLMPFNDRMTVAQLIDIVTFLNSRYELLEGYSEIYYR